MLVRDLEKKLKKVDPRFNIRYKHSLIGTLGGNIAGVFLGSQYLFRIPQGEITIYGRKEKVLIRKAEKDDVGVELRPAEYRFVKHRGLNNLLRLLRGGHYITQSEMEWLSNPNT